MFFLEQPTKEKSGIISVLIAHPRPGRQGSCFLHQEMRQIIIKTTLIC